ncbi:MAG: hypothetical protein KAJ18_04150 [Candidatus Omnitrophica bacterium]|nr:hypothetical protein [Candidatus Omnitrophota bacterium]
MKYHKSRIILITYVLFFAVLFLQFPLKGDLPGNTDTWAALAFSNSYFNIIKAAFSGEKLGVFMYPAQNPHVYGESSIGIAAVFIIFKFLGFNDINAYYLLMVTLFSLTAFSVYLLTKLYLKNDYAAVFAGLYFTCSNYTFGNIDDPIIVFFCLVALCFYFLKKYFIEGQVKFLYTASVLGGIQVYFSAYLFLFLCIGCGILLLFHFRLLSKDIYLVKSFVIAIFLIGTIAGPFFYTYFSHKANSDFYNPYNPSAVAQLHSLNPIDFTRVLPNNLVRSYTPKTTLDLKEDIKKFKSLNVTSSPIVPRDGGSILYGPVLDDEELYYVSTRICANLGIFICVLSVLGFFARFQGRNELLVIGILGVCLALGPGVVVADKIFPGPMIILYKYVPLSGFLRVPTRAFFLTLLCMSIYAGNGLIYIMRKARIEALRPRVLFTCIAALLFFVENIPVPLPSFGAKAYAYPQKEYAVFLGKKDIDVILNLPSNPGIGLAGDYKDLHSWARECIYMNWQTYHKKNILNGLNGYFPRSRLEVQKLIQQLPGRDAVEALKNKYDLDCIIFHKNLIISEDETRLFYNMKRSEYFNVELETEELLILKFSI